MVDRWRYQVAWQPVPGAEDAVLGGRWLLVVPAGPAGGRRAGLAGACAAALAGGGAQVVTVTADAAGLGREVLAGIVRQAAGDGDSPAWCRCWRWTRRGRRRARRPGLAGTLALVQALGDAGIGGAAVGADPGGGSGRPAGGW